MGLRPASGGVRSHAEPERAASMQVEEIPPAPAPVRSGIGDHWALF